MDSSTRILDNVTGWFPGNKESSVHAAQEAVMHALGEDVTYDELLGVSSHAFRLQVSKEGMCPSSPHSFCGWECHERSSRSLPWSMRIYRAKPDDEAGVAEARRAVVDSIDRGVPVQYGSEEEGIIIGYQEGGAEWICYHPMTKGGRETFVETKWPWGIAVYAERRDAVPPRKELAREAIVQAVEMAHAREVGEKGGYYIGFAAWHACVEKLEALDDADDETRQGSLIGNAWIYECLAQFRAVAARYLRGVVDVFPESVTHIERAANLYGKLATEILTDADHCVIDIAPYPWKLDGRPWSSAMRAEQIRRLREGLPVEREAVTELEKALAA